MLQAKLISNKILKEDTKNLIEYDLEKRQPVLKANAVPSNARLWVSGIFIMISFFISPILFRIHIKIYDLNIAEHAWKYYITSFLFYLSIFMIIWFTLDLVLLFYIKNVKRKYEISFSSIFILNNNWMIKLTFIMMIYSSVIGIVFSFEDSWKKNSIKYKVKNHIVNDKINKDDDPISLYDEEIEKYENLKVIFEKTVFEVKRNTLVVYVFSVGITMFMYLLKISITQYINYKIHQEHYKDRIDANNRHINQMLELNQCIQGKYNRNLYIWAEKVFNHLCEDNNREFGLENLQKIFGDEEGRNLFKVFDENLDNTVSKKEFIYKYLSFFNEKFLLKSILTQKNKSLSKLNSILWILFFPISTFIIFCFLGHKNIFSSGYKKLLGILLPLSFIFRSVMTEAFHSILFIFTVRPFEVGDMITIDNVNYEVYELGILFTTLISDSRKFYISNDLLRKKPIINLRPSKYVTESYEQHYHAENVLEKIPKLKNEIKQFLAENSKLFGSECTISNYRFHGSKTLKINISIQVSCSHQCIGELKKRSDLFKVFLHNSIGKLGIIHV